MPSATQICKSLAAYLQSHANSETEASYTLDQVQHGLQQVWRVQPQGPVIPEGVIPKHKTWQGLRIDIENPKGTMRKGVGENGVPWQTYMFCDYGYIRKTEGEDGDAVDVFLGPDLDTAKEVYIVHQRKAPGFGEYDEDKCMLGFCDQETARRAYLAHYDKPDFCGPMESFSVADFVKHVKEHHKAPGTVPDNYLSGDKLTQRLLERFQGQLRSEMQAVLLPVRLGV